MSRILYQHSTLRLFHPRYILTWILFAPLWLIAQLPYAWILNIASACGLFLQKTTLFPKRREIIKRNITLCFSNQRTPDEIQKLINDTIMGLAIGFFETLFAWFGRESEMAKLRPQVTITGLEHVERVKAQHKPMIIFTIHHMSQELISRLLDEKKLFYPVFRHMKNPVVNYLMQIARAKIYHKVYFRNELRTIIQAIKQGEPVCFLPDQDFGRRKSVFAPFFGIMAATSPLLSKYAKMTQAVVIPAYAVRRKNIPGFDVFVEQPIDIPSHSEQHPAHLIEDATRMNQMIEHMILQDISSYFWPMRRFRTRPNPQDKIYS